MKSLLFLLSPRLVSLSLLLSLSPSSSNSKKQKKDYQNLISLLERDEPRRRRRPDPGLAVLDRLVRDRELAEVVAHHVGLDLDLVEGLAVVDADHRADHLRDDDGVAEVGADGVGLLVVGGGGALGGAELLDEGEGLALEAALEAVGGCFVVGGGVVVVVVAKGRGRGRGRGWEERERERER